MTDLGSGTDGVLTQKFLDGQPVTYGSTVNALLRIKAVGRPVNWLRGSLMDGRMHSCQCRQQWIKHWTKCIATLLRIHSLSVVSTCDISTLPFGIDVTRQLHILLFSNGKRYTNEEIIIKDSFS